MASASVFMTITPTRSLKGPLMSARAEREWNMLMTDDGQYQDSSVPVGGAFLYLERGSTGDCLKIDGISCIWPEAVG